MYKHNIFGTIEKAVTRIAGLIIVLIIISGLVYSLIYKKNIEMDFFNPALAAVFALLFVKVMINIMAPRK
jgi:hypothetical protein